MLPNEAQHTPRGTGGDIIRLDGSEDSSTTAKGDSLSEARVEAEKIRWKTFHMLGQTSSPLDI